MTEIIYEKSQKCLGGVNLTHDKIEFDFLDDKYKSKENVTLPELSELEVMRHFKELSDKNFCVETGFTLSGLAQ